MYATNYPIQTVRPLESKWFPIVAVCSPTKTSEELVMNSTGLSLSIETFSTIRTAMSE